MGTGASACPACPRQPPAKATIYKAVSGARHAGSQRSVLAGREGGRQGSREGAQPGREGALDQSGALMGSQAKHPQVACLHMLTALYSFPKVFHSSVVSTVPASLQGDRTGLLLPPLGKLTPSEERLFAQNPTANQWQRERPEPGVEGDQSMCSAVRTSPQPLLRSCPEVSGPTATQNSSSSVGRDPKSFSGTVTSQNSEDHLHSHLPAGAHAQSCPTLSNPRDCSPPAPSVHGIFQVRTLEWVAIPLSRGSS